MKRVSRFDCILFLLALKESESSLGARRSYDRLIDIFLDNVNLIDFLRYKENS